MKCMANAAPHPYRGSGSMFWCYSFYPGTGTEPGGFRWGSVGTIQSLKNRTFAMVSIKPTLDCHRYIELITPGKHIKESQASKPPRNNYM